MHGRAFQDLIDETFRADRDGRDNAAQDPRSRAAHWPVYQLWRTLAGTPDAPSTASYVPVELLEQAYGDAPAAFPVDAHLPTDDAAVARELNLTGRLSPRELQRLRREFARTNHPDRVPAALRPSATQRMTTANALIDAAIAKHNERAERRNRARR